MQTRRTLSARRVYDFYEALHAAAPARNGLGGSLLLYEGLGEDGRVAALAGSIAGVATLGIDANMGALKHAVSDGVCDFMVNHLDEALRILKNEVRKKQPVSVCLQQDFAGAVSEIVDRGVQPEFLALGNSAAPSAVQMLRARGAIAVLPLEGQGRASWIGVNWTAASAPALWLPKIDALAASVLDPVKEPQQDQQHPSLQHLDQRPPEHRLRWLRLASRYLGRLTGGTHFLPMTVAEAAKFRELLEERVADRSIGCTVRLAVDGSDEAEVIAT